MDKIWAWLDQPATLGHVLIAWSMIAYQLSGISKQVAGVGKMGSKILEEVVPRFRPPSSP